MAQGAAGPEPPEPRLTRTESRQELLADEQVLKQIVDLRYPPKTPRWHESAGLVGLLTLVLSTLLSFGIQRAVKRDEQRLALQKVRLEHAQAIMTKVADLNAGLLLSAEDRTKMAKGRYNDLDSTLLDVIRDSTNAADLRWRVALHPSRVALQFHFGEDRQIVQEWDHAQQRLQAYADCADSIYRKFLVHGTAPPEACLPQRDSALHWLDLFNGEVRRGYRDLERF